MQRLIKGLIVPVLLLLVWYLGSSAGLWNSYIIPSPGKTLMTAKDLLISGVLIHHVLVSFYRVFVGFTLAFLLGFPLGILLGMKSELIDYLQPILEFIRHIPPLATVPMLVLWFGIGELPKLIVIILAAFFPIFLNTLNGVLNCDVRLMEVGDTYELSSLDKFLRIIFPSAFPHILMGMRLGLGYSWRSLVGAEIIAATAGIGYMILNAELLSRPDIIIVGILTIGILGSAIDFIFFRITRKFISWEQGGVSADVWG